jgi:hypothetical protein
MLFVLDAVVGVTVLVYAQMHCMEVVVDGGADEAVARAIWDVTPTGCQTVGTTKVSVVDDYGSYEVSFSRPGNALGI